MISQWDDSPQTVCGYIKLSQTARTPGTSKRPEPTRESNLTDGAQELPTPRRPPLRQSRLSARRAIKTHALPHLAKARKPGSRRRGAMLRPAAYYGSVQSCRDEGKARRRRHLSISAHRKLCSNPLEARPAGVPEPAHRCGGGAEFVEERRRTGLTPRPETCHLIA